MTNSLPPTVRKLSEERPELWQAYQALGKACGSAGPLDQRTRRLVKLALSVGGGSEGAVHSHARRALEEGLAADELRQVAILAVPTLGFPRAVAALTWIDDILIKQESG